MSYESKIKNSEIRSSRLFVVFSNFLGRSVCFSPVPSRPVPAAGQERARNDGQFWKPDVAPLQTFLEAPDQYSGGESREGVLIRTT